MTRRAFVDDAGTTRLEGKLTPDPSSLGFGTDSRANVTLLVTPNATVLGDVSPGVVVPFGVMMFTARVSNPNPSPHTCHFQGFASAGGNVVVTLAAGDEQTVSGIFRPQGTATYQIWATDDQAADPGEVGCLVVICQTACYFPVP